jgi:hypothetical protein
MGKLLADISERGVSPAVWQEIRDDMQADLNAERALLAG